VCGGSSEYLNVTKNLLVVVAVVGVKGQSSPDPQHDQEWRGVKGGEKGGLPARRESGGGGVSPNPSLRPSCHSSSSLCTPEPSEGSPLGSSVTAHSRAGCNLLATSHRPCSSGLHLTPPLPPPLRLISSLLVIAQPLPTPAQDGEALSFRHAAHDPHPTPSVVAQAEIAGHRSEAAKQKKIVHELERERERHGAEASDTSAKFMATIEEVRLSSAV
jgi:hypothetical protein